MLGGLQGIMPSTLGPAPQNMSGILAGPGMSGPNSSDAALLRLYRNALLASFSEVFDVQLLTSARQWHLEGVDPL